MRLLQIEISSNQPLFTLRLLQSDIDSTCDFFKSRCLDIDISFKFIPPQLETSWNRDFFKLGVLQIEKFETRIHNLYYGSAQHDEPRDARTLHCTNRYISDVDIYERWASCRLRPISSMPVHSTAILPVLSSRCRESVWAPEPRL